MRSKCWFEDGISFDCTRCGTCCTGEPGSVFLTSEDIQSLIKATGLPYAELVEKYFRIELFTYTLQEKENFDCIFWDQGCTIYEHRPLQCRTFPFWLANMRNERKWGRTKERCPGIGEGRHYSKTEILKLLELSWHRRLIE